MRIRSALFALLFCGLFAAGSASDLSAQVVQPTPTTPEQEAEFRRAYHAYTSGAFFTAIEIWMNLAEQGHIKSMNNLGTMYAQGKAVSRNYPLARFWYRRSAARGDARAMYNMGLLYEFGRGVDISDAEAADWYRQAAQRGLLDGMNALAWVLSTSPDSTVRDGHTALRWANAALRIKPGSKTLSALAAAHAELGEYRQAVGAIDRAIEQMKLEVEGATARTTDRELFGLLRLQGRVVDVISLLERQEYYRNGLPTRD